MPLFRCRVQRHKSDAISSSHDKNDLRLSAGTCSFPIAAIYLSLQQSSPEKSYHRAKHVGNIDFFRACRHSARRKLFESLATGIHVCRTGQQFPAPGRGLLLTESRIVCSWATATESLPLSYVFKRSLCESDLQSALFQVSYIIMQFCGRMPQKEGAAADGKPVV